MPRTLQDEFNDVMDDLSNPMRVLFDSEGLELSSDEDFFIRQICMKSTNRVHEDLNTLNEEFLAAQHRLESSLLLKDGNVEPALYAIDNVTKREVVSIRKSLDSFNVSCSSYPSFATHKDERATLKSLLAHSQSLTDLLGIPALVHQCTAAEAYGEAVALLEYFSNLDRKYNLSNTEVGSKLAESMRSARAGVEESVESVFLTKSLSVHEINNLFLVYRMLYPNSDLESKFVEARTAYCVSKKSIVVSTATSSMPGKVLKGFVEYLRVHVSELVSQYKALFPVSSDGGESYSVVKLNCELARFVLLEVSTFIQLLNEFLPRIPWEALCQNLADLYQQLSFVAIVQLNGAVNSAVHRVLEKHLNTVIRQMHATFKSELSIYTFKPFMALIKDEHGQALINLTRHRPLAILYNDTAHVLNQLRIFPLFSVFQSTRAALDETLLECFRTLISHAVGAEMRDEWGVSVEHFCRILTNQIEMTLGEVFEQKSVRFVLLRNHSKFLANPANNEAPTQAVGVERMPAAVDTSESSSVIELGVVDGTPSVVEEAVSVSEVEAGTVSMSELSQDPSDAKGVDFPI